jgi:HD-GYP domain-containing protein (c-di-GMP phosphodiesterase class II)
VRDVTGLAALLNDIGKLICDNDENHVVVGYNLLKQNNMFKPTIFTSVYQHHEYEYGTGPIKIGEDKIYEFAKIINMLDLYINIINNEKHILPHEAIEKISALSAKKLILRYIGILLIQFIVIIMDCVSS